LEKNPLKGKRKKNHGISNHNGTKSQGKKSRGGGREKGAGIHHV